MSVAAQPQHLAALARANEFRLQRAQLKREIKVGEVRASGLLAGEIPEWLSNMPIEELLRAVRRLDFRRRHGMLYAVEASTNRPVGELTVRQRGKLANLLLEWEAKQVRNSA